MSAPTETRCTVCGRPATTADRYCGFCGARLDGDNVTPTAETTGPHRPHVDRIQSALRAATIGEYDIAGEIGRGGMAVVFLAHDLSLNRKVAIKALLPELLYTEGMDRRFKHEARIAAKLDHPNILVIHGVREANELLFIVMKLVEGLPLSAVAKVSGPLPIPVVRMVVRNVADALSYAHGEGVVHRDVKPANIMIDRRGNVVVMDFGIAKAADDSHLTRTGLVIGTPAYMSPEQCLAQGVSSASDQYSLGVVAYELLTGRTPFRGSALEMQWSHATAAPPPIRTLRTDCPPELEAVVLRMMAKSASERWSTLHDVSHALADDPATANTARATLVRLVADAPGRRDATLPTTPASPLPIGPGPAAAGDATTDPVRVTKTTDTGPPDSAERPNAGPMPTAMLTLSQQRIELKTGDSVELIVELDAGENATDGSSVEWVSSNPGVALVSRDGFVTAVGPGLAEVTCVWHGQRAVCLVHVAAVPAAVAAPVDKPTTTRPVEPVPAAPRAASNATRSRGALNWRWLGTVAAGIVAIAVYRGVRSNESGAPNDPATVQPLSAVPPVSPPPAPQGAGVASAPNTSPTGSSTRPPAPPALPAGAAAKGTGAAVVDARGTGRTTAGSSPPRSAPNASASTPPVRGVVADSRTAAATNPAPSPAPAVTPPVVAPVRADSTRLTSRVDSGAGYGGGKSATATSASPTPTPARDSTEERIPPAPREIATALFREFASAINQRAYTRITAAYSQPSDPAAFKQWQEFLVFVRDYTPNVVVRSTSVNQSVYPPTITASLDFRWSSDAGFERVRSGSFTGIGVPIPGGWSLHRVQLAKKFW